jgi:hypothetical protein
MKNGDKPAYPVEWRAIEEFNGLYEVSNYGGVRSLDRVITHRWKNTFRSQLYKSTIIKPQINKHNGYVYVGLTDLTGKQHSRRVHRLVAIAFIANFENLPEVNHEDFDKQNNTVSNLKWCDRFYQNQHAATKPGRKWQSHRKGMSGVLNPKSRPVVAMEMSGEVIGYFESGCLAARALNVNQAKVTSCCKGKRKHTKFIQFQYA